MAKKIMPSVRSICFGFPVPIVSIHFAMLNIPKPPAKAIKHSPKIFFRWKIKYPLTIITKSMMHCVVVIQTPINSIMGTTSFNLLKRIVSILFIVDQFSVYCKTSSNRPFCRPISPVKNAFRLSEEKIISWIFDSDNISVCM